MPLDLYSGTTFPTFHWFGRIPVERTCLSNNDKYSTAMCLVLFNSLELISSTSADDESFIFSIRDRIPELEKVIEGNGGSGVVGGAGDVMPGSFENMDEKATIKCSAHLTSLTSSPTMLVRVIV